jgi:hypothetical protein
VDNIRTLEYPDGTGTDVKLSDEDIKEVIALEPFRNHLQDEVGLKTKHPVDFTNYLREDFLRYLDYEYDPDHPTKYDQTLALATQLGTEKNEAEMKKLASTTANAMSFLEEQVPQAQVAVEILPMIHLMRNTSSLKRSLSLMPTVTLF